MIPSSHDQSRIQTWVSKYHWPIKGPGLLGEVFGSRSGAGKIQEAQNICGARKLLSAQERGDLPQGHSGHLEGLRMAKAGQLEQRVIVLD